MPVFLLGLQVLDMDENTPRVDPPVEQVGHTGAQVELESEIQSRLPNGYRQGMVTAATFLLSIALAYARFYFTGPGEFTRYDWIDGPPLVASIVLLMLALFRALDLEDEKPSRFRTTRKLLMSGTILFVLAVAASEFIPEPPEDDEDPTASSSGGYISPHQSRWVG
jgi:hypothetical protein